MVGEHGEMKSKNIICYSDCYGHFSRHVLRSVRNTGNLPMTNTTGTTGSNSSAESTLTRWFHCSWTAVTLQWVRKRMQITNIRTLFMHINVISDCPSPCHVAKLVYCTNLSSSIAIACCPKKLAEWIIALCYKRFPTDVLIIGDLVFMELFIRQYQRLNLFVTSGGQLDWKRTGKSIRTTRKTDFLKAFEK